MAFDPDKQLPGGPKTSNEALFDALVRHQIGLMQLSGSIRNEILGILNRSEIDITRAMRARLPNPQAGLTTQNQRRMRNLQRLIRKIRREAWGEAAVLLNKEMHNLAIAEPIFIDEALRRVAVVAVPTIMPPKAVLTSMVKNKPFNGKVLSQWTKDTRAADISRIESAIVTGVTNNETIGQITRRVVGTVRQRGINGVTEITRRNAAALARTAVNGISNQAKREFYAYNKNIIDKELYVATLDGRTTAICRSLDGKRFEVGIGSIPPMHFSCRSLRVAVMDGDELANRPAVPVTQKMLLREFTQKNGLPKVGDRASLPRGTKGAFDKFSRTRIRQLTGTVPGKVTYQQFLKRQSAAFQDDVLGKAKGKLFRKGGLDVDRFVDRSGNEKTLVELTKSDANAFTKAGLDLDNYSK